MTPSRKRNILRREEPSRTLLPSTTILLSLLIEILEQLRNEIAVSFPRAVSPQTHRGTD